jgi:branched-chain amino acid transport system ATP-binding protein
MPLLEVDDLHVSYGHVAAVRGVSFVLQAGQVVALLGSNGAGKSTILRTLIGLVRPARGAVRLDGTPITGAEPAAIVRAGVALCPEGRRVFPELTVLKNLQAGAYTRADGTGVGDDLEEMFRRFPILRERRRQLAGRLSGGEQQMLAIARALMARPRVLLLDEPSLGLAPLVVRDIGRIVREIRAHGVSIVLAEQNAFWALRLADHALVLETGAVKLAGTAEDLRNDPSIRGAYLGG